MTDRGARGLAWGLYGVSVAMIGAGVVLSIGGKPGIDAPDAATDLVVGLSMGLVGALVGSRRRRNPLGWLLLGLALVDAVTMLSGTLAVRAAFDGSAADARWAAWVWNWITTLIFPAGLLATIILLFPDGRTPSPRWRWVVVAGWAFTAVAIVLVALDRTPIELMVTEPGDRGVPPIANPLGLLDLGGKADLMWFVGLAILLLAVVGQVVRLRRARGRERQQLKWFAYVVATTMAAIVALLVVALIVGEEAVPGWGWDAVIIGGFGIGVPAAFGVAILGHGLYEIDVVIRKTVVYAVFAAFATAVYAALVVGLGTWVGRDNSFLTTLAAVLVALTFQPVRSRLTRFANRLVYGRRATPYEVLSEFAGRLGETYASDDLLPRMAAVLGEATGGSRADVWLRVGDELRPAASWPTDAARPVGLRLVDGELPPLPEADVAFPVRHRGELLGALALAKPPSEPVSPTDEKLASDLAAQAGLVLRNARLTTELEAKVDELRSSQKRIVAAQDAERRKLERDIHDGAQQQLVAISVKARLARGLTERDPANAAGMLEQIEGEIGAALEDLRDLARGIYPPLLADAGLEAALRAHARKAALPVEVRADGIRRYPREVEAAVYFSCLEALQNVGKYAGATAAVVTLRERDGGSEFEVADDGRGFDTAAATYGTGLQGIADRLAALDGELRIASSPGSGTTVTGRIPVVAEATTT